MQHAVAAHGVVRQHQQQQQHRRQQGAGVNAGTSAASAASAIAAAGGVGSPGSAAAVVGDDGSGATPALATTDGRGQVIFWLDGNAPESNLAAVAAAQSLLDGGGRDVGGGVAPDHTAY